MALYRANEDATILWPDGSVRANGGEVFEGFDTDGTTRGIRYASGLLHGWRKVISPAPDGAAPNRIDVPPGFVHADWIMPKKAVRKKKASKKKSD